MEAVFAALSSDVSWDAWSEMSDFDFEIDIGNFGVVSAVSSLVVAETRLKTSGGQTDSYMASSMASVSDMGEKSNSMNPGDFHRQNYVRCL